MPNAYPLHSRRFIFAGIGGLVSATVPFVIGYFPDVHWSSYLSVWTLFTSPVAVVYLCITQGWNNYSLTSLAGTSIATSTSTIPWIPMLSALSIGVLTNIYRITSIYGCNELESFGPSSAGIIANLLSPIQIIMTALFAFCFFAEKMTPLEVGGACLIGGVVPVITIIKAWRRINGEGEEDEEEIREIEGDVARTNIQDRSASAKHQSIENESTPLLA